jgi:hypothetical protein
MRRPFTLYKKETKEGLIWHARFWNEKTRKYSEDRSTGIMVAGKKERYDEAFLKANALLPTIVFKNIPANEQQTVAIIGRKSVIAIPDMMFLDYISDFWGINSDYVKDYALTEEQPHSGKYLIDNEGIFRSESQVSTHLNNAYPIVLYNLNYRRKSRVISL